jgi:type II secretory pathway pseudopilin PulG
MVEILTVMAIILILVGLLIGALKFARNSAAQSRTKVQLETLRGMLTELQSANQLSQSPPSWLWFDSTGGTGGYATPPIVYSGFTMASPAGTSITTPDFWQYPFTLSAGNGLPQNCYDSLDAPGDVGTDGTQAAQRNGSFAILNTQLAMQMLAAIPVNRTGMQNLPANSTLMPVWQKSTSTSAPFQAPIYSAATPLLGILKDDNTDPIMANFYYAQGTHVSWQGHFYYAAQVVKDGTQPVVSGTSPWYDETASPRGVPLLIDGWSNPIIYVPASGLRVKLLSGYGGYTTFAANPTQAAAQNYIVVSPEGHVTGNGTANPYVDHLGKPFFASAGPDGDFTKGDDNLYSFNN